MRQTLQLIEQMLKGDDATARKAAELLAQSDEAQELLASIGQEVGAELILSKNNLEMARVVVLPGTQGAFIPQITAGDYQLHSNIGRLIWSKKLQEQDVIFTQAFPTEILPAAAQTENEQPRLPSLSVILKHEALKILVYPGRESATLCLQYRFQP